MKTRNFVITALCSCAIALAVWQAGTHAVVHAQHVPDWPEWGRTPQHTGAIKAVGQSPVEQLADINYDPFVAQEQQDSGGELLIHYQVPLIDGNGVFLEFKTGTYTGPNTWDTQIWNERAFAWQNGVLTQQWNFQSDWKPEPNGAKLGLSGWEPVFHGALGSGVVYVPGFSGSVYKLKETDGTLMQQFAPFGTTDANTFVSGPLTIDAQGDIFYNAVTMSATNPYRTDIKGAWLVEISAAGQVQMVSYSVLVPNALTMCGKYPCGSQRAGINVAPAISADGKTIYTISRAHIIPVYAFAVAVNAADLTPKWHTSLRHLGGNADNLGYVTDQSSASPTATPDGGVLMGVLGNNGGRGYLDKFNAAGKYLASYNFGWDITPAIYVHDGTYSVILKDNEYETGGPYYITQLDANLAVEWQYENPTRDKDHPNGYEWCINAPAVDENGTVYVNSEDGNVYVINQGGTLNGKLFLQSSVEAAYTPLALGLDGKIYTENDGDMFAIGN